MIEIKERIEALSNKLIERGSLLKPTGKIRGEGREMMVECTCECGDRRYWRVQRLHGKDCKMSCGCLVPEYVNRIKEYRTYCNGVLHVGGQRHHEELLGVSLTTIRTKLEEGASMQDICDMYLKPDTLTPARDKFLYQMRPIQWN